MCSLSKNAPFRSLRLTLRLPMNRWSYSTPIDQSGANPYSKPAPNRAAPTGFVDRGEQRASPIKRVISVAGYRGAAFHVEQGVVPGVADLTGDQPKCIETRAVEVGHKEATCIAATEISPVTLAFDAPHPTACLPAIAELATDRAARRVMATFRPRQIAKNICYKVPAIARGTTAAVDADIKAAPVVDHGDHGWRLGVPKIGGKSAACAHGQDGDREPHFLYRVGPPVWLRVHT